MRKGMVVLGWGLKLVGRDEKGELQESRVECASAQEMERVALYVCARVRVWQVGVGGPQKPSYLLSHLCWGNPTPSRIPVKGRSQRSVTPTFPRGQASGPEVTGVAMDGTILEINV